MLGIKKYKSLFYFIVILFFSCFKGFSQYNIPEKPDFINSIIDSTQTLSDVEFKFLEQKLIKYSDSTSTEILLILIPSTKGENINYLGAQWGHKWEIGQEKEDNGVLILLAKNDRKIAINTGYGVEHLLTDAMSKRIIERDIIPYFKQGNYFEGLNNGIDSIFEVLTGAYKNEQSINSDDSLIRSFIFLTFILVIVIILIIAISKGRGGGSNGKRWKKRSSVAAEIIEAILLSGSGRGTFSSGSSSGGFGGWSGGSSSSGGFGGFGSGGGFGGGGASGSW